MNKFDNELKILWEVVCPKCGSEILNKNGKYKNRQRFVCLDCGYSFTTYSKTLLNSTKINKSQWDTIIKGVIKNDKLKTISSSTDISIISISKIKRRILEMLNSKNLFAKCLKLNHYNPFDTTSYFIKEIPHSLFYYYKYSEDSYILFTKTKYHDFTTTAYTKKEFNILLSDIHYQNLEFVSYKNISDEKTTNHIDNLIAYLKSHRGIKSELLGNYCNFYDFLEKYPSNELFELIYKTISTYKK